MTRRSTRQNGQQAHQVAQLPSVAIIPEGDADEVIEQTAMDRIAAAIEETAEDEKAVVKIYRVSREKGVSLNAALTWCEDLHPEEFERTGYSGIRQKWGAGTFRVRLMGTVTGKAGKPGFGIRAQELIDIAPDLTAQPIAAAPAPAPAAAAAGMEAVLAQMAETQRALLEAVTRQQQGGGMQQMLQMLALAKGMREAFGVGEHKQASVLDVLKEMRALKEIGGDLLGSGQAEAPDPLTASLPQLLELVREAGKTSRALPQLGAPGAAVPPVAMPDSIASPPPTGEDTMPQVDDPAQLMQMLQKNLGALIALATANADPEPGATIVYENMPDELLEALADESTWWQQLAGIAPQVEPHREWFTKVRAIVLEWLAEDAAPDAHPTTGTAASA